MSSEFPHDWQKWANSYAGASHDPQIRHVRPEPHRTQNFSPGITGASHWPHFRDRGAPDGPLLPGAASTGAGKAVLAVAGGVEAVTVSDRPCLSQRAKPACFARHGPTRFF